VAALRRLVAAVGTFYPEERAVAVQLLRERLRVGRPSGYFFCFAERSGRMIGYCAYGPVPLTRMSYDLYWIAVDPAEQGRGIGQALLGRTEREIARRGGGNLYIETSSRAEYARTRAFYRHARYRQSARLENFYAPGDDKLIYCKVLAARRAA
jgi:ribosomal protein S18 acetylase RimI-like enzyme